MTSDGHRIPNQLLPNLHAVFDKLQSQEPDDIDWVTLLELRERADPLSDDAWYRGYLVGVADALGIRVPDIINSIGPKPRRRLIKLKRTG